MATSVRPLHKRVGQQLRSLRGEHDLTQEMLAARLSVEWKPTSDSTVSNWESGTTPLPLTALEPIAKAFRMDVGYLGRRLLVVELPAEAVERVPAALAVLAGEGD